MLTELKLARHCQLSVIFLFLVIGGCGPKLSGPRLLKVLASRAESLAGSPVILTGLVEEVVEVNKNHYQDGGVLGEAQLYRLRVNVEHVLQGPAMAQNLDVYAFVGAGFYSLARMSFAPHRLYVFYLNQEAGVWRTICDVSDFCVDQILTGRHPAFTRNSQLPVSDDILRILVTRGDLYKDGDMVNALAETHNGETWKRERARTYINLLRQATKDGAPAPAAEACLLLKRLDQPCDTCDYFQ